MPAETPLRLAHRSLYICSSCRQHLRASQSSAPLGVAAQKRWISKGHIRKIQEAEREWQTRAKHIEEGKITPMLSMLEERGYINQTVGYGPHNHRFQGLDL